MEAVPSDDDISVNRGILLECLSAVLLKHLAAAGGGKQRIRKRRRKPRAGTAGKSLENSEEAPNPSDSSYDLSEFNEYLASEIFEALPDEVQTLSFAATRRDGTVATKYSEPLALDTLDDLIAYIPGGSLETVRLYTAMEPRAVLGPVFNSYVAAATEKPLEQNTTKKATECELCMRDWVPLTYHHLIPKQVAAKAIKRGWCEDWETRNVAWLCRACHNFVHGIASNEELARDWQSVDSLSEREDTKKWVQWVGKVRWKGR
ncbi:MAG: hypothetical protein M1828_003734 [Chrysothrix sp. TS-e1954]|nr:MAG: hypothetical protein M1828_003734 [Chrysothrix sp. TS-e1954]